MKHLYRFLIACWSFCYPAVAQICTPGEKKWVMACQGIDATARWNGSASNSCTYNPPTGWTILSHEVIENSNNNGGKTVALLAGGSNFATEYDYEAVHKSMIDILAQYTSKDGKNEYRAKWDQEFRNNVRLARNYSTSHNTIYLEVSANGHGNFWDQKRGWIDVTVKAELLCIGDNDQNSLKESLIAKLDLPKISSLMLISIKNACNKPISIWLDWKRASGDWADGEGPWEYKPGERTRLNDDGKLAMTANNTMYFFAQTTDKSLTWQGGEGSVINLVKGEKVQFRKVNVPPKDGARLLTITCNS